MLQAQQLRCQNLFCTHDRGVGQRAWVLLTLLRRRQVGQAWHSSSLYRKYRISYLSSTCFDSPFAHDVEAEFESAKKNHFLDRGGFL